MLAQSHLTLSSILNPYKLLVEQKLNESVNQLGVKNLVRDACEYALLNGGKRFRPALVFMIAKVLNRSMDLSKAAMAIEFFHTASLIADDLPCMDNDDERRNKPTVHRLYGESVAVLSTYALISAGYAFLVDQAKILKNNHDFFTNHEVDHLTLLAIENVSFNTGLFGATGGQFLDLSPSVLHLDLLKEVIHKKTISLFEISFVFGWLFGGGKIENLDLVKKSAAHFGLAFQIADDLDDIEQDLKKNSLNIANAFGKNFAIELFHMEMNQFIQSLKELGLESSDLRVLADLLLVKVQSIVST